MAATLSQHPYAKLIYGYQLFVKCQNNSTFSKFVNSYFYVIVATVASEFETSLDENNFSDFGQVVVIALFRRNSISLVGKHCE